MATAPAFAATVNVGSVLASTSADTGLGPVQPTHVATVFTAGASGSRIDALRIQGCGTTTAGMLNIWRQVAGAGNYLLIDQQAITAITASSTVAAFQLIVNYDAASENMLLLGAGDLLVISCETVQNLCVTAIGGNF